MTVHDLEVALTVLEQLLVQLREELTRLEESLTHQLPGFCLPKSTPPGSTGSEGKKR